MKINVSQTIKTYEGKDYKLNETEVLTVKEVLKRAVTNIYITKEGRPEELNGADKLALDVLGHRFYSCKDEVDLAPEEIVMLKGRVEKFFPEPRIYVAMCNILDGKPDIFDTPEVEPDK
jgi:hypothetical protein